jgi:hypothetical protein
MIASHGPPCLRAGVQRVSSGYTGYPYPVGGGEADQNPAELQYSRQESNL